MALAPLHPSRERMGFSGARHKRVPISEIPPSSGYLAGRKVSKLSGS